MVVCVDDRALSFGVGAVVIEVQFMPGDAVGVGPLAVVGVPADAGLVAVGVGAVVEVNFMPDGAVDVGVWVEPDDPLGGALAAPAAGEEAVVALTHWKGVAAPGVVLPPVPGVLLAVCVPPLADPPEGPVVAPVHWNGLPPPVVRLPPPLPAVVPLAASVPLVGVMASAVAVG